MRFAWAERLLEAMATPDPCPPHEWVEVTDHPLDGVYMLQCTKDPNHIWPDRARGRR